jgi:hypothetical protein
MDCRWTADGLPMTWRKAFFALFAKSIAGFKSACLWTPLFGLEVDFWTVFGHFWPFLEVA